MTIAVLNQEELLEPLAQRLLIRHIQKNIHPAWASTIQYVEVCQENFTKTQMLSIDFAQVNQKINLDLKTWKDSVMVEYKGKYRDLIRWLSNNLDQTDLDREYLIDLCVNHPDASFVKTIARQISKREPQWALRGESIDLGDCVILRNILNNEKIIKNKLSNNGAMWFIDSGYTNFLTGKKTWHRLVQNHIHHNIVGKQFPADRLGMFGQFPRPWRGIGDKILVVESSDKYCELLGTTLHDWRYHVRKQLQQYTDRPIEFKPKDLSRKTRVSVYDHLKSHGDDYYCVVSQSSAAAIEAIWLGIPVITLGTHVSAPVARTSLNDVNDLYRGPIGDWLCALSYCQFTEKEMLDGTAAKLIRKFHNA